MPLIKLNNKLITYGGKFLSISNDIITNGLILHLDAGNTNSYTGNVNTWYDISGYGNNGNILGATFDNNTKSMVFDGINDKITGNIGTLNAPFTVSYIGKFNTIPSTYEYFGSIGDRGNNTMMSISRVRNADTYGGYLYVFQGNLSYGIVYDINLNSYDWQYITAVFITTPPYVLVYKNGVQGNIIYNNFTGTINTNGTYRIGTWESNTWWLNGNIAKNYVYNRALSSNEILFNYNVLKNRYL